MSNDLSQFNALIIAAQEKEKAKLQKIEEQKLAEEFRQFIRNYARQMCTPVREGVLHSSQNQILTRYRAFAGRGTRYMEYPPRECTGPRR